MRVIEGCAAADFPRQWGAECLAWLARGAPPAGAPRRALVALALARYRPEAGRRTLALRVLDGARRCFGAASWWVGLLETRLGMQRAHRAPAPGGLWFVLR